jgi:hypothetical protein
MTEIKFALGNVVATPGALSALERCEQNPTDFLDRHMRGDWGDLDSEDQKTQDISLAHPSSRMMLMSEYKSRDGTRIWIITEWDRSVTTILLPEEY